MKYTVDRFEASFAILEAEDRSMLTVLKKDLPSDIAEGSLLTLENGVWMLSDSEAETAARIRKKMENLWR